MTHLVTTRTPLRIGLFGGGTDLPQISDQIGGAVINFSIQQYVYVTVKKHSGLFHEKYRLQYSSTEMVDSVNHIKNDIIRECLLFFGIDCPLFINTISDLPSSSGLGGSSSFTVGLVNALNHLFQLGIASSAIAETAFQIERSIKGNSVGRQDAYAASVGGFNLFEFNSKNSISPVTNSKLLSGLLPCTRLYWTQVQRSAAQILSEQISHSSSRLDSYRELRDIAVNAYKAITSCHSFGICDFAQYLNKNREIKYKLSDSIVNPAILSLENQLFANGALATKLIGAGGGGFVLSIFPDETTLLSSLDKISYITFPVMLDCHGTQVLQSF